MAAFIGQGQRMRPFQVKLSFIVILLHVSTYSEMKRHASQDHGAT